MITLFIPGQPQGKGRARAFKTAGGHIGHYTPEKTRTYEGMIRTQAIETMGLNRPTKKPVALDLVINYPITMSWPRWKQAEALEGRLAPTVKPDADNCAKAVKDALNGVVWHDDCQVVILSVQKKYDPHPGVLVTVTELAMAEAQTKTKPEAEVA